MAKKSKPPENPQNPQNPQNLEMVNTVVEKEKEKTMENMSFKKKCWLIGSGVGFIVLLLFLFVTVEIVTVKGNELGVVETWSHGVDENPLSPGTHFFFPAWSVRVYKYDMSSHVFVMNDDKEYGSKSEKSAYKGRDEDAYHVQSMEGQDMAISLNVRYRINPLKVVHIHKTIRSDLEEKLIRPTVMRIVKDEATIRKAIDAYSGVGLVKLQNDIYKDLANPEGELAMRGIIVENFVIEGIKLDDSYIGEIRARQIASQRKLRADEETKAAEAQALKAKAEAQADFNKRVVEAERDKQVGILKSEQEGQMQVIAAKAMAEKVVVSAESKRKELVLQAEGEKEAGVLKAQAIEALGKAEAEATKLKLLAYNVAGSEMFVKMKISENMAVAFSNLRGYLPSNMSVNVISENFMRSIESLMGHEKK